MTENYEVTGESKRNLQVAQIYIKDKEPIYPHAYYVNLINLGFSI